MNGQHSQHSDDAQNDKARDNKARKDKARDDKVIEWCGREDFKERFNTLQQSNEHGFMLPAQEDAGHEVKEAIARRAGEAAREAQQRIAALADINAYNSTALGRSQSLQQTGNWLSGHNSMRQGSLGVANFEQNVPQAQVHPGWGESLGPVLAGIGNGVSMYGFAQSLPTLGSGSGAVTQSGGARPLAPPGHQWPTPTLRWPPKPNNWG